MQTIELEHFEAWLLRQDPNRTFIFTESSACMLCSFLKETHLGEWSVSPDNFTNLSSFESNPLPVWAKDMVNRLTSQGGIQFFENDQPVLKVSDAISWLKQRGMLTEIPEVPLLNPGDVKTQMDKAIEQNWGEQ